MGSQGYTDAAVRARPMLQALLHLPRRALIGLVRLYQLVLSPHMGASCRFTPTCSQYAVESLRRYGAVRGLLMATWRILRCNPWGGHGYDPPRWFTEPRPLPPGKS